MTRQRRSHTYLGEVVPQLVSPALLGIVPDEITTRSKHALDPCPKAPVLSLLVLELFFELNDLTL